MNLREIEKHIKTKFYAIGVNGSYSAMATPRFEVEGIGHGIRSPLPLASFEIQTRKVLGVIYPVTGIQYDDRPRTWGYSFSFKGAVNFARRCALKIAKKRAREGDIKSLLVSEHFDI